MPQQEVTVRLRIRTSKGGTIKDTITPYSDSQLHRSLLHMIQMAELGYEAVTAEWEEDKLQYLLTIKKKEGEDESARTKQGSRRKQAGVSTGKPDKTKKGKEDTQRIRNGDRGKGADDGTNREPYRELPDEQREPLPHHRKPTTNQRTGGSASR